MTQDIHRKFLTAACLSLAVILSGCGSVDRLKNVGKAPPLTPIKNPVAAKSYAPVTMPMPQPKETVYEANSLWQSGARAFFKDQRASSIGDILTVNINISDKAEIDNATTRTRANSEDANIAKLLGFETDLSSFLPDAVDPTNLANLGSNSSSAGAGQVDREEAIELTVAAVVTQVLPNGNLVIRGSQEIRVNFEVRELFVTGIIRPEDISNTNTVDDTQLAEARISYGGRGQITDVQQPRYGQQVFDIIMPF